jgi:hypothetical protein
MTRDELQHRVALVARRQTDKTDLEVNSARGATAHEPA